MDFLKEVDRGLDHFESALDGAICVAAGVFAITLMVICSPILLPFWLIGRLAGRCRD